MTSYRTTPVNLFGQWLLVAGLAVLPPLWANPPEDEIDEYDEDPLVVIPVTNVENATSNTSEKIDEYDEDPTIAVTIPGLDEHSTVPKVGTFLCQTRYDGIRPAPCAAEIFLGERVAGELSTDESDLFFLRLKTHESIVFESFSGSDISGELTNSWGDVLARDSGGRGRNFRLRATLAPGVYLLRIAGVEGTAGHYSLVARRGRGTCQDAIEIGAFTAVEGFLGRPGDVGVYVVHTSDPSDWLIDVAGSMRYELKAADCTTSLGLGDALLGATLRSLPRGRTFLFLSASGNGSGGAYGIRAEPR